jgi:uncharacterized SAM-binding protein YcdF (DUF218 family)
MFFVLSKLFWLAFQPSNLILWLAIATAVLLAIGYRRAAERTAIAAAVLFVLIGYLPTWQLLMWPLENRYPRPQRPQHVDGIVVLSSGFRSGVLISRGAPATDYGTMRVVSAYRLARAFPKARVIFSGGSGALAGSRFPESLTARFLFLGMGLDPKRLALENKSRNTYENLLYSKRIARPKKGEAWVLATSAFHMPRAMAIAKALGWQMQPWPTDYQTRAHGIEWSLDIPTNLALTNIAFHEWIGLAVYEMTGRAEG